LNEVKIAEIVFSFNNSDLINLLKLRGQHIMYQRFDKMREVEGQISELKNTKFSYLTRPNCALITFEEEDGYLLAIEFKRIKTLWGKVLPS
jgi:hypothetical protein